MLMHIAVSIIVVFHALSGAHAGKTTNNSGEKNIRITADYIDGYLGDISPEEAAAILLSVGALDSYKSSVISKQADDVARNSVFPIEGATNGERDAFRHIFWQCRLSQYMQPCKAEKIGNIHETFGNNTDEASKMDLHNNQIGRNLAKAVYFCLYLNLNNEDCARDCVSGATEIVNSGDAMVLNGNKTDVSKPQPCSDDPNFFNGRKNYRTCSWISKKKTQQIQRVCKGSITQSTRNQKFWFQIFVKKLVADALLKRNLLF